jgi:hypothetical protein
MTLDEELAAWSRGSRRFRAFRESHADKIRKKSRVANDPESIRDVRAELAVAFALLRDRRFDIAYEAYGVGRRGPDFTVTFGATDRFNVEVTRLRGAATAAAFGRVIVAKLRQLPSGVANVLVVAVDAERADVSTVASAVRTLRGRVDRRDEAVLVAADVRDGRGFYDRYLRLSGVIVWAETAEGDARAALWADPSARFAVPERAARACLACLRMDATA